MWSNCSSTKSLSRSSSLIWSDWIPVSAWINLVQGRAYFGANNHDPESQIRRQDTLRQRRLKVHQLSRARRRRSARRRVAGFEIMAKVRLDCASVSF